MSISRYFWQQRLVSIQMAFLAVLALLVFDVNAEERNPFSLRDETPDVYEVKQGDTLWAIAGIFLNDPSRWPDIWKEQPQIENPHLIYPGDRIRLKWVDGQPTLVLERSDDIGTEHPEPVVLVPSLKVLSPAPGEILYFRDTVNIEAVLENHEAQQVEIRLIGAGGQDLINPRVIDLSDEGERKRNKLPLRIPEQDSSTEAVLEVSTSGAEPLLTRSFDVQLERQSTYLNIGLKSNAPIAIDSPVLFVAETSPGVHSIEWLFEGVWQAGGEEIVYIWDSYGEKSVVARAVGPDGLPVESSSITVDVPIRPLKAQIVLKEGDEVIDSKVGLNAELTFDAKLDGDWRSIEWRLDGEPLPKGTQSLLVSEFRPYELTLDVQGTPEVGTISITRTFRPSDRILFYGLMSVVLIATALLGWIMLNNQGRFTRFQISWSEHNSDTPRWIHTGVGSLKTKHVGRWNWLSKTAVVDMGRLLSDESMQRESFSFSKSGISSRDKRRLFQLSPSQPPSGSGEKWFDVPQLEPMPTLKILPKSKSISVVKQWWLEILFLLAIVPIAIAFIRITYNAYY